MLKKNTDFKAGNDTKPRFGIASEERVLEESVKERTEFEAGDSIKPQFGLALKENVLKKSVKGTYGM